MQRSPIYCEFCPEMTLERWTKGTLVKHFLPSLPSGLFCLPAFSFLQALILRRTFLSLLCFYLKTEPQIISFVGWKKSYRFSKGFLPKDGKINRWRNRALGPSEVFFTLSLFSKTFQKGIQPSRRILFLKLNRSFPHSTHFPKSLILCFYSICVDF